MFILMYDLRVLPFSILLQIQVTRRAIECLFVHKYSDNRMTVFQFISGLSFYGASSFCVMEMMLPSSPELFSSLQLHHILAVIVFIISSYVLKNLILILQIYLIIYLI